MSQLAVHVRPARAEDAEAIARVYIASWHDTYAGMLPAGLLCAMTIRGQTARWQAIIRAGGGREAVLVAEHEGLILGMSSFGAARDGAGDYDGEVYTLYVDPDYFSCGAGRLLLAAAFDRLRLRGFNNCIIWAHAGNPARFFYEAMGGRMIARRTMRLMGQAVPETAFGWQALALAERAN